MDFVSGSNSRRITIMGMFTAIIFILAFTPVGMIRLPFINATTIHIPVIIGSVLLGAKYGAALGFMFGLTSLISNTMTPNPLIAFVFSPMIAMPGTDRGSLWALVVCFIPRILVGVVPWYVFKITQRLIDMILTVLGGAAKNTKNSRARKTVMDVVPLVLAGLAGSFTNTLLVLHLIYLLFKDAFAAARDIPADTVYTLILSIIVANGIPEAIGACVLVTAVCGVLFILPRRS